MVKSENSVITDNCVNLLPHSGEVYYFHSVFGKQLADNLFYELLNLPHWQPETVIMFGKKLTLGRMVAWYSVSDKAYKYSGITRTPNQYPGTISQISDIVTQITSISFNSCLANLYHNGNEYMGYHSDNEPSLGLNPIIASVSFGDPRPFTFKHRETKESIKTILEHGSILLMAGQTQHHWLHALPKTSKSKNIRINLTFRNIIN